MRNRFVISITTVLVAALLIVATGCKANPEKAKKKYLESGLSYADKKQYDAAVIQFRKALQVDPKYAEAHYQLAEAYLRLASQAHSQTERDQFLGQAFQELNQTVTLDPKNLKATVELGNLFLAGKIYKKAEEQARKVLQEDPNDAS